MHVKKNKLKSYYSGWTVASLVSMNEEMNEDISEVSIRKKLFEEWNRPQEAKWWEGKGDWETDEWKWSFKEHPKISKTWD